MLSLRMIKNSQEFMEIVTPLHAGYSPAEGVNEQTKHLDLTLASGGAGVGKDTLIRATGLPRPISDTTRFERENDGVLEIHGREYYFRNDELDQVHQDIIDGKYVQWAPVHGKYIYGSRIDEYPNEGAVLLDVVAREVSKIRDIADHFKSLESTYIVAPDYEIYEARFSGRGNLSEEEIHNRREEAYDSLHLGLDD
jgi:guanylate kinase